MKEWFKKRVTFSNQNLLQELLVRSRVDHNNFMRMKHSTLLEPLHVFLYQRLDSIWNMLCNLSTHNANELRNSRVAQKISEQFWFYATDCANCQSAPYTVNQLRKTHCCATWLIVNGPLIVLTCKSETRSKNAECMFGGWGHWGSCWQICYSDVAGGSDLLCCRR
jgi:hypothetical protein